MVNRIYRSLLLILVFGLSAATYSQSLKNLGLSTKDGLTLQRFIISDSTYLDLDISHPLFSFNLNGKYRQSDDVNAALAGNRFILNYEESLKVTFSSFGGSNLGWRGELALRMRDLILSPYQMYFPLVKILIMYT